MSDSTPPGAPQPTRPDTPHLLAAGVCAGEALVLLGFCGFYLWEITQGASDDVTRAVMSTVLIAIFAVALGGLARAWALGADWPNTPTIVWNALLLPVAWTLVQGGRALIGVLVGLVALAGIAAAATARTTPDDEP